MERSSANKHTNKHTNTSTNKNTNSQQDASPALSPTFSSSTTSTSSESSKTPLPATTTNTNTTTRPTSSTSNNNTPNININPLLEAETMVIHTNNHTDSSNDTNNTHSDDDHDEDYIDIDFDNESSLEEEIIPTIFIRALISGGNRYHPEHTKQPLVKIRVRPNCLTKDALGRSIVQAINATTGVAMQYHSLDGDSPIEGMFLEDNGLFVPLDDILHSPLDYNETLFCLSPPQSQTISKPNTLTPPKDPSTTKTPNGLSLFIIAAVTTYLLNQRSQIMLCGECIAAFVIHMLKFILYVPFGFDQIFVHWPLEQLYRHGPSFLGWEGARLSSICARITYYGDESFWLNNMTECERTYAKKVAASMFVRKPMVYFLLCYATFKVLSLLRSFRKPPKNDPDMEETFQAIHSIVRQLKKAAGKP